MSDSAGTLWAVMRAEAVERSSREPVLASFYHANILNHGSLEAALACVLAVRLETGMLPAMLLRDVVDEALRDDPLITAAVREDLLAHRTRDPACDSFVTAFLYYKGFHALQVAFIQGAEDPPGLMPGRMRPQQEHRAFDSS